MDAIRQAVALVAALTLLTAGEAHAAGPATELATHIDRIFKTLEDPALKTPDRAGERRMIVRVLAEEIFDFPESARRALGRHWNERTPEEQARFVRVFTDLLDRSYLRRVELYDGEQVVVTGETIQGDAAIVQSMIVTNDGSRTGVEYLMHRGGDRRWRVWDVQIAGMSLVASYRAQFSKIIRTSSWEDLMRRLEARVGGNASP